LRNEFPKVYQHLTSNYLEVYGTFSSLFMTLFVYTCPFEQAARLFELFIIDGEMVLIKLLLRMIEVKEKKILSLQDMELQQYMLMGLAKECTSQFQLAKLLD
jgi:undecaprenyl pyrophosphate phosphatase UppP